jgi:hypothetical protein
MEVKAVGLNWNGVKVVAENRWWCVVDALCSKQELQETLIDIYCVTLFCHITLKLFHSIQSLLSSRLLSRNVKVKIYKTIILPVVLYGCET